MTSKIPASRTGTHLGQWARVWEVMEERGLPIDSTQAKTWRDRYDDEHASHLLAMLDGLQDKHLPMEAVTMIGDAIIAAFEMGKTFDGRIS